MFLSVVLIALSDVVGSMSAVHWKTDYAQALQLARQGEKPLAVFIGEGKDGWKAVTKDRELDPEARKLLAAKYICLCVDAGQTEGKEIAALFDAKRFPTLVISDKTKAYQAFRHTGAMESRQLASVLERLTGSEPETLVRPAYYSGSTPVTPTRSIHYCPT